MKTKYTGYTKAVTAEDARALFAAKHGHQPLEIIDGGAIWLVGPIGVPAVENNSNSLIRRASAAARQMTETEARQLALEIGGN